MIGDDRDLALGLAASASVPPLESVFPSSCGRRLRLPQLSRSRSASVPASIALGAARPAR
jgi:hypothetical protein